MRKRLKKKIWKRVRGKIVEDIRDAIYYQLKSAETVPWVDEGGPMTRAFSKVITAVLKEHNAYFSNTD